MRNKLYALAVLNVVATIVKSVVVAVGLFFVSKPLGALYVVSYLTNAGTTYYAERLLLKEEQKALADQLDQYGKALGVGNA